jgi:hypothetical protein
LVSIPKVRAVPAVGVVAAHFDRVDGELRVHNGMLPPTG